MGLESTIVCVDNSDYMRNGDFIPSRFAAQQDAVSLVCHSKTRSHPENNVGLMTMTSGEVLVTLTTDVGRILSKLHQVQPSGNINFATAVKIAHLALKHRLGRNHKPRIVVFVGSPVNDDEKELTKMAKRLKKEKVQVDIINFGEPEDNTSKLETFIETLNGKDGTSSHLVTVSTGPNLSDALASSPIVAGEDGAPGFPTGAAGFDMGFDPNEDAELALALRMSMEEQRARQATEAHPPTSDSAAGTVGTQSATGTAEDAMLEQALTMSSTAAVPDFSAMTEDDQIAYALQMSLATPVADEQPMETDEAVSQGGTETEAAASSKDTKDAVTAASETPAPSDDFTDVVNDPQFLHNVLESLPGVDPNSEPIRSAVSALTNPKPEDKEKKDDKDEQK